MSAATTTLRQFLDSGRTIWAAGAYDALSALLIDRAGFDAVFTTGFGISASLLGRPDVELYTLTENVGVVHRITDLVSKPVFADADTGYGNVINVQRTVREFENAGVAALSLEDQFSPKRCPAAAASRSSPKPSLGPKLIIRCTPGTRCASTRARSLKLSGSTNSVCTPESARM